MIFTLNYEPVFADENNKDSVSQKLWHSLSESDIQNLKKVTTAIQEKDYEKAMDYAKLIQSSSDNQKVSLSEAVRDIVLWNKYSGKINPKKISFTDISSFVIDNPYLPNLKEMQHNVETVVLANDIPYKTSESYFKINPALSTESKIFVVESKIQSVMQNKEDEKEKDSERKDIQNQISKIWIKENFTHEEEKKFLAKYNKILTESDYIERIERLLWDNRRDEALRILGFVDKDHQNLFRAIEKISQSPKYIDNIVLSVPRKLRSNELLLFQRMLWYKQKDMEDNVIDLIIDLPEKTKFSEKWWNYRRLFGREMLKQKRYKEAYQIISSHNLNSNSSDFWEAEWTSGWIALRFLEKPKIALNHFINFQKNVSQPVTVSRAFYWLGMTYEAMDERSKAVEYYKSGTAYPTFFYGQLSIHKHRTLDPLGAENDIILPKSPTISGRDIIKVAEARSVQIAYLLALSGDSENAGKIFEWIVLNSPTDGQVAVIMKIINELGDRQLDAKISRIAAKKNVFFIRDKFQIVREVSKDEHASLVHAIIKQESGFLPSAVSKVGALGFMQLMPETAKLVAKEAGIKYDRKKLATDIKYNITLGSFYIKKLITEFDNSEMLAIASYNAGPNATRRWINEFYDPRKEKDHDKIVDWIELITYSETRNYVQRIIENMIVYKYLMSRSNYDELK